MTPRPATVTAKANPSAAPSPTANGIFRTPGRDELERKKALVEADEGPFAGVQNVAALAKERREVSGESSEGQGGEGERKEKKRRWGCFGRGRTAGEGGGGCWVM